MHGITVIERSHTYNSNGERVERLRLSKSWLDLNFNWNSKVDHFIFPNLAIGTEVSEVRMEFYE